MIGLFSRSLVAVLVVFTALLTGCTQTEQPPTPATTTRSTADGATRTTTTAALPAEARRTLRLIESGGPFPYAKDGTVFANRERLLPLQNRGYYREYTVPTPGESDRGARRIIAGTGGERFYTPDHYRTFLLITG